MRRSKPAIWHASMDGDRDPSTEASSARRASSTLTATSPPPSTSRPRKTRPKEPSPSARASAANCVALRTRAASSLSLSFCTFRRFTSAAITSAPLLERSSSCRTLAMASRSRSSAASAASRRRDTSSGAAPSTPPRLMILRQWSLICCRRRRARRVPTNTEPASDSCHSVQPPPPASVAAKPPSAGKMMKLFDAPRLLFAFALVVFFAFFPISRWSAVPPPLGLPPRLPRDPDANAPLESRAVAIVARAVAIVARLRTDQSKPDRGRSHQLSAPPSEIRTRVSDPCIRERSFQPKRRKSESLVLHFMDVLSSSASALPSSAAQPEAHCQGGDEASTTCREG